MSTPNPLIQRYLSDFRAGLGRLTEKERNELCLEIESHVYEAMGAGQSLADVLDKLGPADRLARAYSAELLLKGSDQRGNFGRFVVVASILAGTSLTALVVIPLLFGIGLGFGVGGVAAVIAGLISLAIPSLIALPPDLLMPLPLASALVVLIGVILSAVGWGAFSLLRHYFVFLTTTFRRTFLA